MSRPAILALDQGTTNTKALLVALDGEVLASASAPTGVQHTRPGWAEQSAVAISDTARCTISEVLATCPQIEVVAIGITNQRESVVAWDSQTSAPLAPAVIWQCRRSADLCAELREAGHEALIRERTGLGLDPLFSAGKLRWLIDNVPAVRAAHLAGNLRAGTVDSWLLWNLTAGAVHVTDPSNASRTQLLDLERVAWDKEVAELFGVPLDILPEVRPSNGLFGHTSGGFGGLPDGIPIHAVLGDSHAALVGHQISEPGRIKVTLGTGSSLMATTANRPYSSHGLSDTIAWATGDETVYALEGNITVSGHSAAFSCALLGIEGPERLTDLALSVPDTGGVYFVPALAGLGAPHWNEHARGLITGLSLGSKPAHIARATLEAIAHQICDVVAAMEADLGDTIVSISADGSAARNDTLLQWLADLAGKEVLRPACTELSAVGAAMMAADGAGIRFGAAEGAGRSFMPQIKTEERSALRAGWHHAIGLAKQSGTQSPNPLAT